MEKYLININDLIVNDQVIQYDFLSEMYPIINEAYNKLWFYENLSIMKPEIKDKKIISLKNYIKELLKAYKIPENILLINIKNNDYLEPISSTEFKLIKQVKLQEISEDSANEYIDLNKRNVFFKNDIPYFKQLTKTKYKKR